MPGQRILAFFDGFRDDGKLDIRDYLFSIVVYSIAGAVYVCDGVSHLREKFLSNKSIERILEEDELTN